MEAVESRPPFREQLQNQWDQGKFLCIGLDPDYSKIPEHLIRKHEAQNGEVINDFVKTIIDTTHDIAAAYKPNIAFYEWDDDSSMQLWGIVDYIHALDPEIPVIGDVKRADIGNTNRGYAQMAFERYGFDAITTNPYLGGDTFPPFQSYENKGLIVLCRTTNPGSKELQDMPIDWFNAYEEGLLSRDEWRALIDIRSGDHKPLRLKLYEMVAFLASRRWDNGQMGLVVGATDPTAFEPVRKLAPNMPFLIPGIGTQGGNLEASLKYAPDSNHQGIIINNGSAIIHASQGEDFAEAARKEALAYDKKIREGLGIA